MEDNTNLTNKMCQNCKKPVRGRSDKKFCSDMCRNAFHNRLNSHDTNLVRHVTARLLKNRRILKDHLGKRKCRVISDDDLQSAGFHMSYMTHRIQTGEHKYRIFCYDYSFENVNPNKIKISHLKNQN